MSTLSNLPRLMGVLNVTPDSFSDGGKFTKADAALSHAAELIAAGATVIDVGGESTRPGAERISAADEQARVIAIVEALTALPEVEAGLVKLSIDTMNASTAALAVAAGASIVNDVSGGLADSEMFATVANLQLQTDRSVSYILGHWHNFEAGAGAVQQSTDIVADVFAQLRASIESAVASGASGDHMVIDPGLGFGKSSAQNWQLVEHWHVLAELGHPILIGASRKRFIAEKLAEAAGCEPAQVGFEARDEATAKLGADLFVSSLELGLGEQLWGLRVHNVAQSAAELNRIAALRFAR